MGAKDQLVMYFMIDLFKDYRGLPGLFLSCLFSGLSPHPHYLSRLLSNHRLRHPFDGLLGDQLPLRCRLGGVRSALHRPLSTSSRWRY